MSRRRIWFTMMCSTNQNITSLVCICLLSLLFSQLSDILLCVCLVEPSERKKNKIILTQNITRFSVVIFQPIVAIPLCLMHGLLFYFSATCKKRSVLLWESVCMYISLFFFSFSSVMMILHVNPQMVAIYMHFSNDTVPSKLLTPYIHTYAHRMLDIIRNHHRSTAKYESISLRFNYVKVFLHDLNPYEKMEHPKISGFACIFMMTRIVF